MTDRADHPSMPQPPSAEELRALSWLRKEVQRSIEAAHKAVQRHLREALALRSAQGGSVDPGVLRTARDHLHQAAGALELAGQSEAALLVRAGEKAVHRMVQQPELANGDLALGIERAGFAINDYLGRLTQGQPASSVGLFQPYRALMGFTEHARIHPADLWRHDWRWRAIAGELNPPAVPADDSAPEAMERLVLRLMRAPDRTTLQRMSDLCAGLGSQAKGRRATLWRLASAFFEAQAFGLIRQDVFVKRAASRLLAQVRQGLKPGELSDQLARDLLFFCAGAADTGGRLTLPRLDAVRAAYALAPGAVPDYESPSLGRTDPAWLALARKRLAAARETWGAAVAGEPAREGVLVASVAVLQESLEKLYANGSVLGQALVRAAETWRTTQPPPPALALEVATTILLLEAALDDTDPDTPRMPQRLERLAERLNAASAGGPPQDPDAWMAEVYRRVSDSQTLKNVVVELRSTLAEVERTIDTFFKHPEQGAVLGPVDAQLGSLRGVLAVLGLEESTRALQRMRDDVAELARDGAAPSGRQALFDRLADNLGALGFTVDILGVQPELARSMFSFDDASGLLRSPSPSVPADDATLGETLPDSVMGALAAEQGSSLPTPGFPLSPEVDSATPPTPLSIAREASETAPPSAAVPASTPTPTPTPTPESGRAPVDAEHEDADEAEMRAVFVEETAEVFQQAREALSHLDRSVRDVADDLAHMTSVRRAFHTLKGSSRMVGLGDLGEAAWACEQLYNARLAQSVAMTPPLRQLTQQALAYLESWVQAIAAGDAAGHEPDPVVRAAEALRLRDEALPIRLPQDTTPEPALAAAESVKVIGPLRVEIAMFNIFLNEADELARQLTTQLAEWTVDPTGPPGESIETLAHSLAGSSASVGHTDLATLARALEYAVARSNEAGRVSDGETALYTRAASEISRLLHQFAAGFLEGPSTGLVESLDQHEPQPRQVGPDVEPPVLPTADVLVEPATPVVAAATPAPWAAVATPAAPPDIDLPVLHRVVQVDDDVDAQDAVDLDLFANFREEAEDLLPRLQSQLRDWQANPQDRDAAAACMRTLHTYKGAARLVGATRQGELAHRLETAVQALLQEPTLGVAQIDPLTWRADALDAEFVSLRERVDAASPAAPARPSWDTDGADDRGPAEATDPQPSGPASSASSVPPSVEHTAPPATTWIPAHVPVAAVQAPQPAAPAPEPVAVSAGIDWTRFLALDAQPRPETPMAGPVSLGAVRVKASLLDRLANQAGETSMARARLESDLAQVKSSLVDLSDNLDRLRRQLRDVEMQAESQISSRMEAVKAAAQNFDPLEMDRYTRVQELTRIMAETVNDVATVQRSLQRALQSGEDQVAVQGRLLRTMQDDLMRTRMVEFESLAERLYRVVRQAAKDTGKLVRLDIVGGSIELDRGVLERMTAPFEHLLRNALAHGIEDPARRVASGKDATGLIEINLTPQGNEVIIELRDDGVGLDLPTVRARAQALGLLPQDRPARDEDLAALIFAPGLSTADRVTELSGRGVGLDVVRAEVLGLGGRIELSTSPGLGTTFRMVLPLTTAVTQVLMLRAGDVLVAVPANLVEGVRSEAPAVVEAAYRHGHLQVGEAGVPFHSLGALLGGEPLGALSGVASPVVVCRSAAQRVALHVDEVVGDQEVVVKHLGPQLSRLPGLAGISLLPSGLVAAIYNPVALATHHGAASRQRLQVLLDRCPPGTPLVVPRAEAVLPPLVLVVDDSLTVRRVTQRLLLREGYRVNLAKDGQEALERLAEELPAVVLSDIEMPRMDGFELVRRMRTQAAWMSLPVVMITSRIAQKHRDLARELGVRHYLGKPYGEDELLAVVATYARDPRTAAQALAAQPSH